MDGMMLNPLASFANRRFLDRLFASGPSLALAGLLAAAPTSASWAQEFGGGPHPWQLGLPAGATVVAQQLYGFHNGLLLPIITVIAAFVLLLLGYTAVRYRRAANPVASRTTHNTLIEVIWTAVPVIILVVIALPSFRILYYADRADKPEMTLKVTGHQWYWSYELPDQKVDDYISNLVPDDKIGGDRIRMLSVDYPLVVPVDTTIQVLITGADVIHSWLVAPLGVQKSAVPGRLNESWMRVDHEGTYFGQCTQICGDRHGYMPIEVRAVSKEKFAKWVDLVLHSTAKDKMRDANEKVLGIDYSWMDAPAKTASSSSPAPQAQLAASR
jgi:cytochrome c oxidase subunit 2